MERLDHFLRVTHLLNWESWKLDPSLLTKELVLVSAIP